MNRYHPIANPDTDLTINGTTIRHIYDADRIWVHNADLAEAIGALAKGCLLSGVSPKWKRKWREDLGGGKATRAVTYLVAEGLLQRSMSMKRYSDSYPRLREAIDQIRTLEAERRTQHAAALTTAVPGAVPGAAPKEEPTLPLKLELMKQALAEPGCEAEEAHQKSAEVIERVEKAMKSLAPLTAPALRNANLGKRQRQVRERMSQIKHLLDLMHEDLVDAAIEKDITN